MRGGIPVRASLGITIGGLPGIGAEPAWSMPPPGAHPDGMMMAMPPRSSLPQANAATGPILGVTLLALGLALVFFLFFQISKGAPFRSVNPFGEDPYDAVGSIAVEVALFVSALSCARALRLHQAPALQGTIRFIVLGAVGLTLLTDIAAEVAAPPRQTGRAAALLAGLALLSLLTLAVGLRHGVVFKRIDTPAAPNDLTPAEGLEDLWTAFVFVLDGARVIPAQVMGAARGFRVRQVFPASPGSTPRSIHGASRPSPGWGWESGSRSPSFAKGSLPAWRPVCSLPASSSWSNGRPSSLGSRCSADTSACVPRFVAAGSRGRRFPDSVRRLRRIALSLRHGVGSFPAWASPPSRNRPNGSRPWNPSRVGDPPVPSVSPGHAGAPLPRPRQPVVVR